MTFNIQTLSNFEFRMFNTHTVIEFFSLYHYMVPDKIYLLYKAEIYYIKLKSRLSDRHADSSVVCACIDVGLGLCRAVVFGM